ncbi:rhodanese-like domain-containing protein [Erythrobacter sp.]|uniref:rhodanese-like domain-containing protein n=1 Tax=Erythrobacter sp. TaxID=1042 RepID=UPI001425BEE9|nr:rhodanese-like domain-containing protein [Erythrobacter sp.]QIQ87892.1 MAG: rhodanese-like domain-containing protein [Erythrobacter sp.]
MRTALFLPLVALAACAPSDESGEEKRAPATPFGFELASAQEGIAAPVSPVIDLAPAELRARLGTGAVRLIDVRTDAEVAEGIIPGAEHIALDRFDPAALALSEDEVVVLYCRSGRRSGIAAERLAAHTGEPAAHLAGGILAWQQADGEIVRPE